MPRIAINGHTAFYRLEGRDTAPVVVLVHALGLDHRMWDPQLPELTRQFTVLRYDLRGHGASGTTAGEYSIAELGADALSLVDALGIDRFAFCGLSIGGMIGQWLALNAPARVARLVLANSSPRPHADAMETRRRTVLAEGLRAIEPVVISRYFRSETLEANPPFVSWARRTLLATNPIGYAGCAAAVRDMDLAHRTQEISAPTVIISGTADQSLPWAGHGDRLAAALPEATVVHLASAHLSNLEQPRAFTAAVTTFLNQTADA